MKSIPLVQFKVCQLHRQLDERVRVQLFLLDGSFSESREGVTDNLEVLCLDNRQLSLHRPHWQRLFYLTKLTHQLKELFFSSPDVTADFFIHSKHQLLGRRQDSDCLHTLRNVKTLIADAFNLKSTENGNGDYLPFASGALNLLVHVPAHGHQHHGIIRRVLQNEMMFSNPETCRLCVSEPSPGVSKLTSQLDPNVPSE